MDNPQGAERLYPGSGHVEHASGVDHPLTSGVAAVHLLTAPAKLPERTAPFIDRNGQAISWPSLLETSRPCRAERLPVHAALELWNGTEATPRYDALTRLDDPNFARLVEALRLRRPGCGPSPSPLSPGRTTLRTPARAR
jgi:hypothetical protein